VRVLIVDDEPLARRGIVLRLEEHRDVEIVGEAGDAIEAHAKILELRPDLMFLDIRMPGRNGLELLADLPPGAVPAVIFLTAYDQYAVEAFEREALDYVLKPIDGDRFDASLARARRFLESGRQLDLVSRLTALLEQSAAGGRKPASLRRFVVRRGRDLLFIPVETVDWIEAVGDYAALHVGRATHLIRQSLNSLEEQLDAADFIRVHRSAIVRVNRIRQVESLPNRDSRLILEGGVTIAASRTYSRAIRELLRNGQPAGSR